MATVKQFQDFFVSIYENDKNQAYLEVPSKGAYSTLARHIKLAEESMTNMSIEVKQTIKTNLINRHTELNSVILSLTAGTAKWLCLEEHLNNLANIKDLIDLVNWNKQNTPESSSGWITYIVGNMQIKGINQRLANK